MLLSYAKTDTTLCSKACVEGCYRGGPFIDHPRNLQCGSCNISYSSVLYKHQQQLRLPLTLTPSEQDNLLLREAGAFKEAAAAARHTLRDPAAVDGYRRSLPPSHHVQLMPEAPASRRGRRKGKVAKVGKKWCTGGNVKYLGWLETIF
jgi:hypothetical protein